MNTTSFTLSTSARSLASRPTCFLWLALVHLGCTLDTFGYTDGITDPSTSTSTSADPTTNPSTEPTTGDAEPAATTGVDPSGTTSEGETTGTMGDEGPPDAPVLELILSQIKQFDFSWTPVDAVYYELHESLDGGQSWHLLEGDIAANPPMRSYTVPLHLRENAVYYLKACNGMECSDSNTVAPTNFLVDAVGYFKASNTEAGDGFGRVALNADGDTLAVGAPSEGSGIPGVESDNSASHAGAVYVYKRANGSWVQQAYIKASNPGAGDAFGSVVALSDDGDTLAVGAPYEDSSVTGVNNRNQNDNSAPEAGAAYVFKRNGDIWSQQAYIKASNPGAGDAFGQNLALSGDGNTLAVAAPNEASNATFFGGSSFDNSATYSGAVYVFKQSAGVWSEQKYIKASNTEANDGFGQSVALSYDGNTLAVGASNEDSSATGVGGAQNDNLAPDSGAVYVFRRMGESWSQPEYLKASNTDEHDKFGISVALSAEGDILAVGASGENSGDIGNQFDESADSAGAIYVFEYSRQKWLPPKYLKASTPAEEEYFGGRVAVSADGTVLAAGVATESSKAIGIGVDLGDFSTPGSGAVYVFTRAEGDWPQKTYVKAPNTDVLNLFGSSVALNENGGTLAVGAPREASKAKGVSEEDQFDKTASAAGAVFLY